MPREWKRAAAAPSYHRVNLKIGLKRANFQELERHLHEGESSLYNHWILSNTRYSRIHTTNDMASISDIVKSTVWSNRALRHRI